MHAIVTLNINGDRHEVGVPAHFTLLEALRYGAGLTGSKQGCDKGDCGACTVLVNDVPVLSCITPVWEAEGGFVLTVEGLAARGALHPLQDAFDERGAAQCGFCTPGILMSAHALLLHNRSPNRQDIREALSGNLCRCTGYTKIYEAIEVAAERMQARDSVIASPLSDSHSETPGPNSFDQAAGEADNEQVVKAVSGPGPGPDPGPKKTDDESPEGQGV